MLSLVLRHQPDSIGITLDENGWTDVKLLIKQMNKHSFNVTSGILKDVLENNNKQRFAFNDDKSKIRAVQGHSVNVNLGLVPQVPPPVLYHGTGEHCLEQIQTRGLHKMNRQHVHLSAEAETAKKVGQRKGKAVILKIEAAKMHKKGHTFFVSENNVWLTDHVPPAYIKQG
ncbi:MAG: phosphotransferase KptA/Tpt1 [Segetibacter sp.]|jgi:putative RNA 2'-phosphotransferase|nr:phosphotransferase KptA/Tpt1 [Segetibacter sp.]